MDKAQQQITELENSAPVTQTSPIPTSQEVELRALWEEAEAQAALTTKKKWATQLAEFEIERLRLKLHQSLDKEADIGAKEHKAVKALQDKLNDKIVVHGRTKEERDKLHEEGNKKETIIMALREAA